MKARDVRGRPVGEAATHHAAERAAAAARDGRDDAAQQAADAVEEFAALCAMDAHLERQLAQPERAGDTPFTKGGRECRETRLSQNGERPEVGTVVMREGAGWPV